MSNFRGISAAVRRAINNGILVGKIEPQQIREILPETKRGAPTDVIFKSLKYLVSMNEIEEKKGSFFVKSLTVISGQQVSVIGELISVKVVDGKSIVTIEAVEMENL